MTDDRYEKLLEAHSALRMDVWSALVSSQSVPSFSHVSEFTNDELIERLRTALNLPVKS